MKISLFHNLEHKGLSIVKNLHESKRVNFVFFAAPISLCYELLGIKLNKLKFNNCNKKVCKNSKQAQVKRCKRK